MYKRISSKEVDKILAKKIVNGKPRYLVKWKRSTNTITWEPPESFLNQKIIVEFDKTTATLLLSKIRKSENLKTLEKSSQEGSKCVLNMNDNLRKLIDEELLCGICFDIYQEVTITGCRHIFCFKCITEWISLNSTCPICRKLCFQSQLQKLTQLNTFMSKISEAYIKGSDIEI